MQTIRQYRSLRLVERRQRPLDCPAGWFWISYFAGLLMLAWWLI